MAKAPGMLLGPFDRNGTTAEEYSRVLAIIASAV
jgi:hypothetical protein